MAVPENRPHPANLTPEQIRQGIERIKRCMTDLEVLNRMGFEAEDDHLQRDAAQRLHERVKATLARTFGGGTVEYIRYAREGERCWNLPRSKYGIGMFFLLHEVLSFLNDALDAATNSQSPQTHAATPSKGGSTSSVPGSKVFIVHGHDGAARHEVARFLERLKLEVIILDEQPNQSRTIIEKFEKSGGEASFAVVLMTPDDIAGPAAAPSSATRARQNVIFELGYVAGKLWRGSAKIGSVDWAITSRLHPRSWK
jgi:hypothetical protein